MAIRQENDPLAHVRKMSIRWHKAHRTYGEKNCLTQVIVFNIWLNPTTLVSNHRSCGMTFRVVRNYYSGDNPDYCHPETTAIVETVEREVYHSNRKTYRDYVGCRNRGRRGAALSELTYQMKAINMYLTNKRRRVIRTRLTPYIQPKTEKQG